MLSKTVTALALFGAVALAAVAAPVPAEARVDVVIGAPYIGYPPPVYYPPPPVYYAPPPVYYPVPPVGYYPPPPPRYYGGYRPVYGNPYRYRRW